jgi:histidine triad (HIT) family protein
VSKEAASKDKAKTETIFSKIIDREIPAQIVFENELVLAFKDVSPQAPVHILIIPKTPLKGLSDASTENRMVLGEMLLAVATIARDLGIEESGYRVVINNGAGAGQTVFHLHMHLLGGRSFDWPPG